ncbi:MAG: PIG-L family deacetylase [Acidobacteria bacterium]|nr:PIG-L family deacetylase [Acidobacteriota bacterium]
MITLSRPSAEIHVPDGTAIDAALARTTHLAIGAHQDDVEIMAADGILQAFERPDRWFTAVVVTDGAGSPRSGAYGGYSDAMMREVRRDEQKKAAGLGEYAAAILLDHPTVALKDPARREVVDDLAAILRATRPEIVYAHNLADKHDTHVALALRTIAALRALPDRERPARVFGCEVWRDLDWLPDEEKVAFDLTARPHLQAALVAVFDSQIEGGKRYDLATVGRRRAHATFATSHGVDTAASAGYAMDLTPLVVDPSLDPAAFVAGAVDRFKTDVVARVARFTGAKA